MNLAPYQAFCDSAAAHGHARVLESHRALSDGRVDLGQGPLVNLASNDYLSLSRHPALIARSREYAERHGTSASASRLLSGNLDLFAPIEEKLARGKGTETALLLGAGFLTNATILAALLDRSVLKAVPRVYSDRLNHASLHAGTASAGAHERRYPHNDLDYLERLLKRDARLGTPAFIITESVFSMDGDRAPVAELAALAETYGAFLYLDEAHATGLLGPHGFGLATELSRPPDLVMGTCSKALGSYGAYIACSHALRRFLIQRCHGLIYSTALPPPVLGAIDVALDLIPTLGAERARLFENSARLRDRLRQAGLDCSDSTTQIIPAIIGDPRRAIALKDRLTERGFLVSAVRPPTVPPGTSRLRITLTSGIDTATCDAFADALLDALEGLP